jgi:predicted DNA-binding protein (MmcQ/YjbR family)
MMDIEAFRDYCLSKPLVEESFPFDYSTLVFKVCGKMFALTNLNNEHFTVNLKCNPERSIELREQFDEVQPGYHMNKKHWNTISFEGRIRQNKLIELIDHSYDLVVKKLPASQRNEINSLLNAQRNIPE